MGVEMNFVEAIQAGFKNYVNFETRASRSEYWYWTLFVIIFNTVFGGIWGNAALGLVGAIFALVTFVPNISISVRRLHDLGKSGWWLLLLLIPIVGLVVILYWACLPGDDGDNRFGSNPIDPADEDAVTPVGA